MISYAYWQSHFNAEQHALAQTLRCPHPRPIVGVLPPGFGFPNKTDIWVSAVGLPGSRGGQNYLAVGRTRAIRTRR